MDFKTKQEVRQRQSTYTKHLAHRNPNIKLNLQLPEYALTQRGPAKCYQKKKLKGNVFLAWLTTSVK